jgi:uncharacterized protein (DUF4415 family)
MTDQEVDAAIIEDPDARPTGEAFWENAQVIMPRPEEPVTIRLDPDVPEWFAASAATKRGSVRSRELT